jgi:hypothetical protein
MNGFYVVPVWIKDERPVVLGGVFGPQPRRSVVSTPGGQSRGVEGIYLLAAIGGERHVHRRARSVPSRDREVVGFLEPELDLVELGQPPDLCEPERQQRAHIELAAAIQIADADRDVIDHHSAAGHTRTLIELGRPPKDRRNAP